jgi:hypothetical protein
MAAEQILAASTQSQSRNFEGARENAAACGFFDAFDLSGVELHVLFGVVTRVNEKGQSQQHSLESQSKRGENFESLK